MNKHRLIYPVCLLIAASLMLSWIIVLRSPAQISNAPIPTSIPVCADLLGQHINSSSGVLICGTSTAFATPLRGTTGSIGGGLLAVGASATGTATISGAIAGQPCIASTTDGTNITGLGADLSCTVTSANTATVTVTAIVALTPPAKTYNVIVFP